MPTTFVEMTHPKVKGTATVPSTDVARRQKRGWTVKQPDKTGGAPKTPPAS